MPLEKVRVHLEALPKVRLDRWDNAVYIVTDDPETLRFVTDARDKERRGYPPQPARRETARCPSSGVLANSLFGHGRATRTRPCTTAASISTMHTTRQNRFRAARTHGIDPELNATLIKDGFTFIAEVDGRKLRVEFWEGVQEPPTATTSAAAPVSGTDN